MKIQINHIEIQEAIVNYVSKQGINITDKTVEVIMSAGRGSNGYSATIDINGTDFVKKNVEDDSELTDDTVEEEETEEVEDDTPLFGNE